MEEEPKQLYRRPQMTGQARAVKILFTSSFPTEFFLSYRAAGMTDDPPAPCRPVHLITSQSCTFYVSLARVFPSSFRSHYLPLPQYIRPQHFPHSVFFISPYHMPVPVQQSLCDLFGSLCHSRCPTHVFVLHLIVSLNPHIHRSIPISTTCPFLLYIPPEVFEMINSFQF